MDLHNGTNGFFGRVFCWLCSHNIMNHLCHIFTYTSMWTWTMWMHTTNTPLNTTFTCFPNIHSYSAMSASPRVALGEWVLGTLGMVGSAKILMALLRNLVFKRCSSMLGSAILNSFFKANMHLFVFKFIVAF